MKECSKPNKKFSFSLTVYEVMTSNFCRLLGVFLYCFTIVEFTCDS